VACLIYVHCDRAESISTSHYAHTDATSYFLNCKAALIENENEALESWDCELTNFLGRYSGLRLSISGEAWWILPTFSRR
jgi:hypothetical protein